MENQNNKPGTFSKKIFGITPIISLAGLLIGAIGGYIYWDQVGCASGTCAITSNPWMSTAWGAAFGYLIFDMFNSKKKGESQN